MTEAINNNFPMPLQYLSSVDAGWERLVVQAFHEPIALEGWVTAPLPDISLVLFTGGTMRMDRRSANGPWKTQYLRQGDLILSPAGGQPIEVRWQGLSREPMQTLHIHLSTDLIAQTAQ